MNTASQQLLHSFDQLPTVEKHAVAVEILQHFLNPDVRPLLDDELISKAEELLFDLKSHHIKDKQQSHSTVRDSLGWSPGFFERTAGAWQGEPLVRPSQGEYDERDWDLM